MTGRPVTWGTVVAWMIVGAVVLLFVGLLILGLKLVWGAIL